MRTHTRSRNRREAYLAVVKEFPLVSIQSEAQLARAQKFADHLLSKGKLDAGEEQYLDALSDLIALYEDAHYQFPSVSTAELLAHLMEAKGITQADLSRKTGIPRSTVSELLSGRRQLSMSHIGPLAKCFRVPPSAFLTDDLVGASN
ncbi:MAG: helix-turn-helix domain-containing protein [Planctomycetaceae bacterium]